ncbi:hypothetical protein NDU88_008303 [Pleurodeles waltl]|uniref:Uncharacterized protein n=1 Tax=Pleurodeles waltl TaxID=8319 RepID=A0AAV7PVT8_PLEWA|nr:hypothetical protein NDU88_008303 [Pleurodeles waltl]
MRAPSTACKLSPSPANSVGRLGVPRVCCKLPFSHASSPVPKSSVKPTYETLSLCKVFANPTTPGTFRCGLPFHAVLTPTAHQLYPGMTLGSVLAPLVPAGSSSRCSLAFTVGSLPRHPCPAPRGVLTPLGSATGTQIPKAAPSAPRRLHKNPHACAWL